jgi:serine/threonine-protein kinase HipA
LWQDRYVFFDYDASFIDRGLELSPFKLPLTPGVQRCDDRVFDGLFGLFNDSLPDGWGCLLRDRWLLNQARDPLSLSPLDKLCLVGSNGMGALTYAPETGPPMVNPETDLDQVAIQVHAFQDEKNDGFVEDLLVMAGSSAGARPKVLVSLDGDEWLVKFRSSTDWLDMGFIEYAYHLMAREAGITLPVAKLFPSKKGVGFFGSQRFDRLDNQAIHMHTMSGLIQADHRIPSLDYKTIMQVTWHLTRDKKACAQQFRRCVFNVLSHNRDDHSKNFAFIMNDQGKWSLSPAYDLTFSAGPGGEHCTTVAGEGHLPTRSHLLTVAQVAGITEEAAMVIMDQVTEAVCQWSSVATSVGVEPKSMAVIDKSIKLAIKNMKK